jgi:hypothetical protein
MRRHRTLGKVMVMYIKAPTSGCEPASRPGRRGLPSERGFPVAQSPAVPRGQRLMVNPGPGNATASGRRTR